MLEFYLLSLSPSGLPSQHADSCFLATGSHNGKINLFSVEEGKKESGLDTRGKFAMSIAYVRSEIVAFYH